MNVMHETLSQNLGSVLLLKIETLPIFLNNATGDESNSGKGRLDMLNCRSNRVVE